MQQTYEDRNRILRQMGFKTYKEYLESELWKEIREKVFAFKGRMCHLCDRDATTLHHKGYGRKALSGEDTHSLVPLCGRCHRCVEFTKDDVKKTLAEAQRTFIFFMKKRKFYIKKLVPEQRKKHFGWCMYCGYRATKGMNTCRRCRKT